MRRGDLGPSIVFLDTVDLGESIACLKGPPMVEDVEIEEGWEAGIDDDYIST
jgi:hypothetical protein